jgi:hypothetical protein
MIITRNPNVSNSRWYQVCVLLSALVLLPLGFAVAQDFDAVERRLGESVSEGELTLEQAVIMIDVLRKNTENRAPRKQRWSRDHDEHHGIEGHLQAVGKRLKAAVKAGKMTEEEARAKWQIMEKECAEKECAEKECAEKECAEKECAREAGIEGHYKRMGISDEAFDRIQRHLHENGIQREQLDMVMGAMLRVIHQVKSKGDDFELDPRLRDYFTGELGLTDQQVELVQGMARRVAHRMRASQGQIMEKECAEKECAREAGIEGHYKRMGISDEAFDRIQRHLHENGIQREQLDMVMGAMLRVIHQVKSKGDDFELDPRLRDYFTGELGLTDQQVELVQGMARRVAHRMRASQGQPHQEYASDREAIEKMVAEGEVSREDADRRLGEMRRAIDSRQGEKGVEPRFIPEEKYTRVEAELKKLVDEGKVSKPDAERRLRELQTANTKAHIEASVKAGKMTRGEADKLYKELGFK